MKKLVIPKLLLTALIAIATVFNTTLFPITAQQSANEKNPKIITSDNVSKLSKTTTIPENVFTTDVDVSDNGGFIAFAPQDLVSGHTLQLGIWDAKTASLKTQMNYEQDIDGDIYSLILQPHDNIIATGNGNGLIQFWDVDTGKKTSSFMTGQGVINSLAFGSDGTLLASGGSDGTVVVLDVKTGVTEISYVHNDVVSAVTFDKSDKWLASSSNDGEVIIWDVLNNKQYKSLKGYTEGIFDIAFHPEKDWIALAIGFEQVQIYDIESNHSVISWDEIGVSVVEFSPNGELIVSGTGGSVKIREVGVDKVLFTTWGGESITFDSNGSMLVLGNSSSVEVWTIGDGNR